MADRGDSEVKGLRTPDSNESGNGAPRLFRRSIANRVCDCGKRFYSRRVTQCQSCSLAATLAKVVRPHRVATPPEPASSHFIAQAGDKVVARAARTQQRSGPEFQKVAAKAKQQKTKRLRAAVKKARGRVFPVNVLGAVCVLCGERIAKGYMIEHKKAEHEAPLSTGITGWGLLGSTSPFRSRKRSAEDQSAFGRVPTPRKRAGVRARLMSGGLPSLGKRSR